MVIIAGVNGLIATAMAAIGSHALDIADSDKGLYQLAYSFHFYHTLAIVGCAALASWGTPRWAGRASIFFLVGIFCFSGSLYWRAVMGPGSLGTYHWITPLGGLAFMGGWITFAWGGWVSRKSA